MIALSTPRLPPQVQVIVRDWLNANHVLFKGATGNVLIDSGYGAAASATLARLKAPEALGEKPLDWLINTHCHSDHMGGNRALQRAYGCCVSVPAGEAPLIARWDTQALWLDYCDQQAERFEFDRVVSPGDTLELAGLAWQALAAPGHDMGALVFYCPEERLLISGDALWENGFGAVMPQTGEQTYLKATRAALEAIAALNVETVIPGHGPPFACFALALERAFKRLQAFEEDSLRMARHFLKVMLVFSLLDKGKMLLSGLPDYLDQVPVYRELNALFFRLSPAGLAELLVGELERSSAVVRRDGYLMPR